MTNPGENGGSKNTESFLSQTMRSAENIISKSSESARHTIETFRDLKDRFIKNSQQKKIAPMARSAPGGFSAHVMMLIGWALFGASLLYGIISYFRYHVSLVQLAFILLIPVVLGLFLIIKGVINSRSVEMFLVYKSAFGGRPFVSINELVKASHESRGKVIKRLEKYQSEGLYPQGYFVDNDNYYVLSPAGQEILEEELQIKRVKEEEKNQEEVLKEEYPKLYAITEELNETLETVQTLKKSQVGDNNPKLRGELKRMARLLSQTKRFILENPEKVPDVRSFLNYFLPTVTKLLGAYYELDSEPVNTPNVQESKEEIESVLSSVNKAFENLYNDFYTDQAIDVYSDVSVLKTMIQQHGLSDSDF